jgi:SAM-dependent methyltransferase
MKLSPKEYWDSKYDGKVSRLERPSLERKFNRLIKKLLGQKISEYMGSYDQYLLWEVIYPEYMLKTKGAKALEVGSAPGKYLVRLSKTFGFEPYGVEYSESGVELNREIFALNDINPDNVIHADFLSDDFHDKYRGSFDIVVSRGFIEHFTNVEDIIQKHINLLVKGGRLFVTIPNYRGVNYLLQWLFNRETISVHNLDIMEKEKFLKLFENEQLSSLYGDYWGTFNFGLFSAKKKFPLRLVLNFCKESQLVFNIVFRLLFKDNEMKSKFFSPHLIYIGEKKA